MPYALPADITKRWLSGSDLPADSQLETFIEDVSDQLDRRFTQPDGENFITTWLAKGQLSTRYITAEIAQIIIEYLQTKGNPYASNSQSYGAAGSMAIGYNTQVARYDLRLTPEDFSRFKPQRVGTFLLIDQQPQLRWQGIEDLWNGERDNA